MGENAYLKWLSGSGSVYWHDAAVRAGQLEAFSNGAVGMTSNPYLIQKTLHDDRGFWAERLAKLPKGLAGDEKAEALTHLVISYYLEETRVLFGTGAPCAGFVCAQTSPLHCGDADYMVAQAKRYAAWGPNLMVKAPATRAGIEAYEECVAQGLNMAATISYTMPQVLAVAEAAERAKKRAMANGVKAGLTAAVMMAGRLDDYLRDVAHDTRANISESDVTTAGLACMKKAYRIFCERGYSTYILPAGLRSAKQVQEMAGARIIFSLSPEVAGMIAPDAPQEMRADGPVEQEAIDRLMTMPEFRKAYEEDGLRPEEFMSYGVVNRTIDQFINDGWNMLTDFAYE